MAASLKVREAAESCPGRESLLWKRLPEQAIPAALASNAGEDKIDALLELRSHRSGNSNSGVTHRASPEKSTQHGFQPTLLNIQFRLLASLPAVF